MPGINMKMIIDPDLAFSQNYKEKIVFENSTIKFMRANIRPGMVCLDIGANVGYFTLLMAKLTGKAGKVFSFEPTPTVFNCLDSNVSINKLENVKTIMKGLSNCENGMLMFQYQSGYDTLNSLKRVKWLEDRGVAFNETEIEVTTIDDFASLNDIKVIDFIKIDVEGNELNVIKGMKRIITNNPQMILLFECGERYAEFGYDIADVVEYLSEKNLRCFFLLPTRKLTLAPIRDTFCHNIPSTMIVARN
jgi:FkbM family methyltransferase